MSNSGSSLTAYKADMILDSISEYGVRLTTMELKYPLVAHNELLTHRALAKNDTAEYGRYLEFSRNASSNRALTSQTIIDRIKEDNYIPDWKSATKGMIAGAELNDADAETATSLWLMARQHAINSCLDLEGLKVHKQWRNRLLSPFQTITVVATANGDMWEHFFALRDHYAAYPEIQTMAELAHTIYDNNIPKLLNEGDWHLPYILDVEAGGEPWNDTIKLPSSLDLAKKISVARCARTSFLKAGVVVNIREDTKLYDDLTSNKPPHASPLEHVAMATVPNIWSGNFVGWIQLRKQLGF